MKKKLFKKISIILLCLLCLNTVIPMASERNEWENEYPQDIYTACLEEGMNVDAKSAILIEPVSGTVLYEKNPDEKFAPASVTKIMTMLLAMEAIDSGKISLDDKITCSENAKSMGGSTMLLDTGEVRTVEEILKGIAIASGNDAAVAMAEFLSGSTDEFVKLMNERAQELGMTNTTFKNCNGLPVEGHLTTARDISIMSLELLKHPTILKYSGTYMETISEGGNARSDDFILRRCKRGICASCCADASCTDVSRCIVTGGSDHCGSQCAGFALSVMRDAAPQLQSSNSARRICSGKTCI